VPPRPVKPKLECTQDEEGNAYLMHDGHCIVQVCVAFATAGVTCAVETACVECASRCQAQYHRCTCALWYKQEVGTMQGFSASRYFSTRLQHLLTHAHTPSSQTTYHASFTGSLPHSLVPTVSPQGTWS
jgi:hypothetical protein